MDLLTTDEAIYRTYSKRFLILKLRQSERIFDQNGVDQNNFTREGINIITNKPIDSEGYNALGYNLAGLDRNGYDIYGYDEYGYDEYGYNLSGRDKDGYDRKGYDKEGYDKNNIDEYGEKRKEKELSEEEKRKKEEIQQTQRKMWLGLREKAEKLAKGQMTIEEYIMKSKTSIDDLIVFAKKEHLPSDVIKGLHRCKNAYKTYTKPFKKNEYLKTTILIINGEEVRPTEQEVDSCVEYLKANGTLICDKTVRTTVSQYKRGKIDITQRTEQAVEESTKTQLEILEEEQNELQDTLENVEHLENEVEQANKKTNKKPNIEGNGQQGDDDEQPQI